MKKYFSLVALLFALVFAFNGVAFGFGSTGGDGSNYRALQETAVFLNASNATLTTGQAVILETNTSEITSGTTLGAAVTTVTSADSIMVVGVVSEGSYLDGTPVVVITKGPAQARCADSSDAIAGSAAVGTTTLSAGYVGGGTNLGIALENGDGTDGDLAYIWVDPTGAD